MINLDTRYITFTWLAASLLLLPGELRADSYLCEAEQASGFVYDLDNEAWEASTFSTVDKKYLISPADSDNVFVKALKYDYAVKKIDSRQPLIHCKSVKLTDSNEETGLVTCRGSDGASFSFDKRNGRFIRSQPTGYVTSKADVKAGNGPYMEIGKCSPK